MGSVVIVSGPPASGKTTLCRALAAGCPNGVHLDSDRFYDFIAHRVDPTSGESHHQNTIIIRAVASAALAYAKGGYTVFLDGVIGPWFLPEFRPVLESEVPTQYVVLKVSAARARARARERQGPGMSPTVDAMQPKFLDLGALEQHAVDAEERGKSEIEAEVSAGVDSGAFALDWTRVGTEGGTQGAVA